MRLSRISTARCRARSIVEHDADGESEGFELPPLALILVRNTVTHDARVLREAATLRDLGYEVTIAGVVSTVDAETETTIGGARVVRLNPGRRLPGRRRRPAGIAGAASSQAASARSSRAGRTLARRLMATTLYYAEGVRLARTIRPELVHANDYNTMWIGIAARVLCGSRLVYDSHELWPDRNGRPEWRPWLLSCEAAFVRLADQVITTSPGYAAVLSSRYRIVRPLVVRNLVSAGASHKPTCDARAGDPVAVYVGGLMPGRGLEQAIAALPSATGVRLRLVGPGREGYVRSLRAAAEQAGVAERLEIAPPVAVDEVVAAIADADVGLMLIQPICLSYELTLPNKLFEYAAAGLPVLASDLPVIGPIVRSEGIGAAVPAGDITRIATELVRLCEPVVNSELRSRVSSFARRTTWEAERPLLERAYGTPAPDGQISPRRQRAWSATNPGNVAIRAELVAAVFESAGTELRAAERILDLGCGTGWWLERLAADPAVAGSLYGIDVRPARVDAAQQRVAGAAEISLADARRLPYPDAQFDVVCMFTVLSSVGRRAEIEAALAEARRVLRVDGVALVWEPRVPNPFNRDTRLVDGELVARAFAGARISSATTTLLPALARRLGPLTAAMYPRLIRIAALRTHRLTVVRAAIPWTS